MKYRKAILVLILAVFMSLPKVSGAEDKVDFSWGFFLKTPDGLVRSLDFNGKEPVTSGDLLRVYLQLHEKSYVYIYLYDSHGDLYQVFPPSHDFYQHSFPAWQRYYIPSSREWFTLDDNKGVERFFVLASNERLVDLEELAKAVIYDKDETFDIGQAVEIIEKKVEGLMKSPNSKVDPTPVALTGKAGSFGQGNAITVNRTTVPGPYGVLLELVNR